VKKIKIALLVPDMDLGGIPRVASDLSMGLSQEYDQTLISLRKNRDVLHPYKGELVELVPMKSSLLPILWTAYKRIRMLKKLLREREFDLILSFGLIANISMLLAKPKCKTLSSYHSVQTLMVSRMGIYGKITTLFYKILRKADMNICVSKGIEEELKKMLHIGEEKIRTIYNPMNIKDIIEKSKASPSQEFLEQIRGRRVLMTLGRTVYEKGQWHLIEAMKYVKNKDVILYIFGDGDYLNLLRERVDALGLNDRIVLPGSVVNPFPYLKNAEVFLLTSFFEGFGNVIVEAQALSVPVVATDCLYGPSEIIAHEHSGGVKEPQYYASGVLIPTFQGNITDNLEEDGENHKVLAITIDKILDDEKLLSDMASKCKANAELFDAAISCAMYERVFKEVL